jgi:hypothetical protein
MRRSWFLLIGLAACGGGGGGDAPDARVTDDFDAAVPDAGREVLTVLATARCCDAAVDTAAEGVSVVVFAPDGTAGATAVTDADGEAIVDVQAGDRVTTVSPTNASMETTLVTTFGVEPGDFLRVGDKFSDLSTATATATVEWTAQVGQTAYLYNDGCTVNLLADTATSSTAKQYAGGCAAETTDILVVSRAGTVPLRWSFVSDVDVVDAATLTMPAFADATTFTVDVTGAPAEVDDVAAAAIPHIGETEGQRVQGNGPPALGAFSVTGPWSAARYIEVAAELTSIAHDGAQGFHDYIDGTATSGALAVSALPWVDGVTVDIANRTVAWTTTGNSSYDAIVVEMRWGDAALGGGLPVHTWKIISPPGVNSVSWPDLRDALDAHEPLETDVVFATVQLIDFAEIVDYESIRGLTEAELTRALSGATRNQRDLRLSTAHN